MKHERKEIDDAIAKAKIELAEHIADIKRYQKLAAGARRYIKALKQLEIRE
jgi:hypothetical protein